MGAGRPCVGPPGRTRVVRLRGDEPRERSACEEAASRRGAGRVRETLPDPEFPALRGRLRADSGWKTAPPASDNKCFVWCIRGTPENC